MATPLVHRYRMHALATRARTIARERVPTRVWWWLGGLAVLAIAGFFAPIHYAYEPAIAQAANELPRWAPPAYDLWGVSVPASEAHAQRVESSAGEFSPANGAVHIDERFLALGRRAFYQETFGNEVFLTDVLGMIDGPIGLAEYGKALLRLKGHATSNLRVEIGRDAVVGGRRFTRGELVDTGIDVAEGSLAPLGLAISHEGGVTRVGITCAACHSTVDMRTGKVIHGAPNTDFNAGLLLALASNSAAFFPHAELASLDEFVTAASAQVTTSSGRLVRLPDPDRLEEAVDEVFLKWPPGSFDSMVDLVAAPTQLPDCFTFEDYPYNWSGAFMAGPFRGLSVQSNNVHALNSDAFTQADSSETLFGVDKEVYLGTLLQRAASHEFRFHPGKRRAPSEFFAARTPTPGAPALNQVVPVPTYPNASLIAPDGLWSSSPGRPVWQQVNAMSAWQNTLRPPPAPLPASAALKVRGRAVFERAGCPSCHSGPGFSNHRVIPVEQIGTEPARARALHSTGPIFVPPVALAFDQEVPFKGTPRSVRVPTANLDPEQIKLAFAHGSSNGGYKVPGLLGLFWSAPYLHDGGVAVGADPVKQVGVPGTLLSHVPADPAQSLRALLDRELRGRVVAANEAAPDLGAVHVHGVGHEFWVDAGAGFDSDDQSALIHYLLTLQPPAP